MAQQEDLNKVIAAMNDLVYRIDRLRIAIINNEAEISILIELEQTLEENIVELKRQYVTVTASEFRKAKEDLKRTKTRMAFLRMDRMTYDKAYTGHEGMYNMLLKQYHEAMERINNNVIQGNFGKKDGR